MTKNLLIVVILVMALSLLNATDSWIDILEPAFSATGVVQTTSGAADTLGEDRTFSAAGISYDIELSATLGGDTFYALLQAGQGAGVDADVATCCGVNGDADDDPTLRLSELWYQHDWSLVQLRAGKVNMAADFDANDLANRETDQFLNGTFINSAALELPEDNGAGMVMRVSPHRSVALVLAAAEADADWQASFRDGFFIAQIELAVAPFALPGNYRFYGWTNGLDRPSLSDDETLGHNSGFGASFDQQLTDDLALFARAGMQDDEAADLASAYSIGAACLGNLWGRPDDTLGLAVGMQMASDDSGLDDETVTELYYRLNLTDHLDGSPDIQYIVNPAGDGDTDAVAVFGIRGQISF